MEGRKKNKRIRRKPYEKRKKGIGLSRKRAAQSSLAKRGGLSLISAAHCLDSTI